MKRLLATLALTLITVAPAAAWPKIKNTPFDTGTWGGAASDVRDAATQGKLYHKVKGRGCLYFGTHKYVAFNYKTFRSVSKWTTKVWKTTDSGKELYFFDTRNRYIYVGTGTTYSEAKRNARNSRRREIDLGKGYRTHFIDVCR